MRHAFHAPCLWAAFILVIGPAVAHGQSIAGAGNAPVTVAATASALASGPCARTQAMTPLQQRIVAKAAQGTDTLRDFIWNTRGIYALEMESTVAWLDRERSGQLACQAAVTSPVVARH